MLIDSNLVLVEADLRGAVINGDPVALTSLTLPGKFDAIPMCFKASPDVAGGTKVTVKLQQSDTKEGVYADVNGSTFELTLAELKAGAKGIKYVPRGVTKQWIKMIVTPTGSFSAGKVFAAVMREDDEPYEPGLYIKDGRVVA